LKRVHDVIFSRQADQKTSVESTDLFEGNFIAPLRLYKSSPILRSILRQRGSVREYTERMKINHEETKIAKISSVLPSFSSFLRG